MTTLADCYSCAQDADVRDDSAPLWERIAADELWRVSHAVNSAIPGWLVLIPRRHVTSLAEHQVAEVSAALAAQFAR